jgi:hypothetical protein
MSDLDIHQAEADYLIRMDKFCVDDAEHRYPGVAGDLRIPLTSSDRREEFILDIHRSRWELDRGTYQNRARISVPLVRIDFGNRPHCNPDGVEVACPHIHTYREGHGLQFAYPLRPEDFPNPDDRWQLLVDFMRFVKIVRIPNIQPGLFV